jgi:fructose-bisphosphate aldolase class II/tagatose 1,6-diphosphate aldolase GatY/KbaY
MKLKDKLKEYSAGGSCLLAANFYNYETLLGILQAASEMGSPVILQLTKASLDYLSLPMAVKMARTGLQQFGVEGWIHLDHAATYELVYQCLEAGFDSVMIDASERPLEENIALTKKVVDLAARYDAHVEAELGYVAKLGQSDLKTGFTEPSEAKYFTQETGVDALAVAIGSAHGFYKRAPELDLERLTRIHEMTDAALVLHGGSGIPDHSLREAIRRGICKLNLATETKNAFMSTLRASLLKNEDIDLRTVFLPAIAAVKDIVQAKLLAIKS